ncbi:MAG: hypothetical protein KTR31_36065 [Myxococcales bacterium]|nr:hypothetical protein [Myxococcales bacterium]
MRHLALFSLLAGCGWNHLPQQDNQFLDEPLWDAAGAVATADALYVRLPRAGALARVTADGVERIDLGEGRVTRIASAPDGQTVVTFLERYTCFPDDRREARRVKDLEDCDDDDLQIDTEILLVRGSDVSEGQAVTGTYNALAFSDDGRFAIAYLDFALGVQLEGVVNLTGIAVLDLVDNVSELVTVGFAPDQVLFTYDDGGNAVSAVVLSRNQVANVNLLTEPAGVTQFPLTLDPDTERVPTGVALTPDGRYALISTAGSSDLYAIDLDNESINIVDLSGTPATLQVDGTADRTVLVYGGRSVAEVMEHDFFEVDTIELDEGMNQVTPIGGSALLWSDNIGRHDLYRLDLEDNELVEYRLQNPAVSLHVAPTLEFAVALTRPEGGSGNDVDAIYDANPGMEVIDLSDNDSQPFLLEGQGLGVAFAQGDTSLNALVLQRGVDYLFRYDLYARQSEEIDLAAPPVAIGTLADGRFWITHNSPLGLVSFLDPITGDVTEVGGFAAQGVIDPVDLVEEVLP